MVQPLKIAVAGCGIGGLAAGALLAKAGHQVTLFDQFARPAPVGSGLIVQPVGLQVLRSMGVADTALAKGQPIHRLAGVEDQRNRLVLDVSYGGVPGLGIHRASLFQILYDAAHIAGCRFETSARVRALKSGPRGASLEITGQGQVGPFDLLVNATGAGSGLSAIRRRALSYGALWATVDWPKDNPLPTDQLSQRYRHASRMAGVLPIGCLPGETAPKAAVFWSLKQADHSTWSARSFDAWTRDVADFWPDFAPFILQVHDRREMTMARYSHGTMRRPYDTRIVHNGDAAHSASPQLGQGANMALLDAFALAQSLAQWPADRAPEAYWAMRRRHVRLYQLISRLFTPLYQSDSRGLPLLRDHLFAPASKTGFSRWMLGRLVSGDLVQPVRSLRTGRQAPL